MNLSAALFVKNRVSSTRSSRPRASAGLKQRRSIEALVGSLKERAKYSRNLFVAPLTRAGAGGDLRDLPRFVFVGPRKGGDYLRLGLFAGIHGDEIAGCRAVMELLLRLEGRPELAQGWEIFAYPVCNPTGYEDNTRFSRRGHDLNRLFWKGSREIEVSLLEGQLTGLNFDGIVSLHADDASGGVYGFARGATLTRDVLKPVLAAASRHLPINEARAIDGFAAEKGIISACYEGVLGAPTSQKPQPFEIILETPQLAPVQKQVSAGLEALLALLGEYRRFIAYGQNL
jgi:protein MpaA